MTDPRSGDMIALDHYPTCPKCGNLCGRLARICVECGSRLHATELDLDRLNGVESRPTRTRDAGRDTPEDVQATEGVGVEWLGS